LKDFEDFEFAYMKDRKPRVFDYDSEESDD